MKRKKTNYKTKENSNEKLQNNKEKRKSNKLIIVLTVILIIVIIIAIVVRITIGSHEIEENNNNQIIDEDNIIINTQEGITKDQEIEGLKFENKALVSQDGESFLTIDVTNTNSTDYTLKEIHITIKDKNGNNIISYIDAEGKEINYLIGYSDETIKAGETREIVSTIDQVIAEDAYTLEYEIIK